MRLLTRFFVTLAAFDCGAFDSSAQQHEPLPAEATVASPAALPLILVLGEALSDPQSKPISASFLSADLVEAFRVRQPQDIVRLTPNSSATDSGSRSFGDVFTTRGLANTVFFGAPATTIYVDDVPFAETFTYAQRLLPVNSVEVLRGPQPIVVGRNSYAGLINVRSLRPGDKLEGALNYGYASFEAHEVDGYIMGPIVGETLGFRLGGTFDTREGYLTNPTTGERVDGQEHWGINGGLFWKPAPGWDISLTASYDEFNDGAPRLTSLDRRTGFYTVSSDVEGRQERVVNNQALRIAYENERFKFLSVTAHRGFDLDPYTIDLDFTPEPFGFTTLSQSQELWSQEFRFSSNDPDSAWQWNAGLYGSMSQIDGRALRGLQFDLFDRRVDRLVTNSVISVPAAPGVFFPVPITARTTATTDIATNVRQSQLTIHSIEEDAFAAFGGVSYRGFEPLTFHLGARLDWVRRALVRDKTTAGLANSIANTTAITTFDPVPFPGFPPIPSRVDLATNRVQTPLSARLARLRFEEEWLHVTPSAGIDWKINDNVLAFAKTTWAFKPGGFSAYADDPRFVPFDEEKAWISEAGLKSQWLDGRLTANVTGFYNAVRDYQVERSFTVTDYAVFNAARAEIYGAEFETSYAILPQLDFLGSIGWTHARLTSYTDPVTGRNLDGVTPPFVPEFDALAALDFHLESGFFARVDYNVTGNTRFDDLNREAFQQDTFGLLSASIGWRGKNWNVALYGTNLTQEEYYTIMNPEIRTGAVGLPREFGVRVGLRF
jgi:iron complex outermembrane receptor protein